MRFKRVKSVRRLVSNAEVLLAGSGIAVCVKRDLSVEKGPITGRFTRDCRVFISESRIVKPRLSSRPRPAGVEGAELPSTVAEQGIRLNVLSNRKVICDMRLPLSNDLLITMETIIAKKRSGKQLQDGRQEQEVLCIAHHRQAILFHFQTTEGLQKWFSVAKEHLEAKFNDEDRILPATVQHCEQRQVNSRSQQELAEDNAAGSITPVHVGDMVLLRWTDEPRRKLVITSAIGRQTQSLLMEIDVSNIMTIQETAKLGLSKSLLLTACRKDGNSEKVTQLEVCMSTSAMSSLLRSLQMFGVSIHDPNQDFDVLSDDLANSASTSSTTSSASLQPLKASTEPKQEKEIPLKQMMLLRKLPSTPQDSASAEEISENDGDDDDDLDKTYAKPVFKPTETSVQSTTPPQLPGRDMATLPSWHSFDYLPKSSPGSGFCTPNSPSHSISSLYQQPFSFPQCSEYLEPADMMNADVAGHTNPVPITAIHGLGHRISPLVAYDDFQLPSSLLSQVHGPAASSADLDVTVLQKRMAMRNMSMLSRGSTFSAPQSLHRQRNQFTSFHRTGQQTIGQRRHAHFSMSFDSSPSPTLDRHFLQSQSFHSSLGSQYSQAPDSLDSTSEDESPPIPHAQTDEEWIMTQALADKRFNEQVRPELIRLIYLKLANRWKHLGRHLSIEDSELTAIEHNCNSTEFSVKDARDEACWSMLNKWLKGCSHEATYVTLISALREAHVASDIIDKVIDYVTPLPVM